MAHPPGRAGLRQQPPLGGGLGRAPRPGGGQSPQAQAPGPRPTCGLGSGPRSHRQLQRGLETPSQAALPPQAGAPSRAQSPLAPFSQPGLGSARARVSCWRGSQRSGGGQDLGHAGWKRAQDLGLQQGPAAGAKVAEDRGGQKCRLATGGRHTGQPGGHLGVGASPATLQGQEKERESLLGCGCGPDPTEQQGPRWPPPAAGRTGGTEPQASATPRQGRRAPPSPQAAGAHRPVLPLPDPTKLSPGGPRPPLRTGPVSSELHTLMHRKPWNAPGPTPAPHSLVTSRDGLPDHSWAQSWGLVSTENSSSCCQNASQTCPKAWCGPAAKSWGWGRPCCSLCSPRKCHPCPRRVPWAGTGWEEQADGGTSGTRCASLAEAPAACSGAFWSRWPRPASMSLPQPQRHAEVCSLLSSLAGSTSSGAGGAGAKHLSLDSGF